jgi:hypothetical protein
MIRFLTFAALCTCCAESVAATDAPVAIVEEVHGKPAGVEFMDYVAPGKVIRLGPGDRIVLSYVTTCGRETISGGTVTVGVERSMVQGGKIERAQVACDGGRIDLSPRQADKAGGLVMRDPPFGVQPQLTLYGLSPMIEARGGGTLVLERLDQPGERHEVVIAAAMLQRGAFFDLAKAGKQLTAGAIYRATLGAERIVFKVDPAAAPGATPIIGRLLRFTPGG